MCGLGSLRTNSCCCGISLRTGTIIILILNLIGGLFAVGNHEKLVRYSSSYWISYAILVLIEVAALYGAFKKKPDFMIPHLVIHAISLVALLLGIIALIIFLPFASKDSIKGIHVRVSHDGTEDESLTDSFYLIYGLIIVTFIIWEAIEFHFFKVILSYYYELKTVLLVINPPPFGFNA